MVKKPHWDEEDKESLRVLRGRLGLPFWAIAAIFQRSALSCQKQCTALKIYLPRPRPYPVPPDIAALLTVEQIKEVCAAAVKEPSYHYDETVVTKYCSSCRTSQPRSRFSRDSSKPDGLQSACRECAAEYETWRRLGYRERSFVWHSASTN